MSPVSPHRLFLHLANPVQVVEHAGAHIPLASRDAALLAWLAIEGPTSRSRLVQLLWPDTEPSSGRNSLRQRLFQLKRQIGVDLVVGGATLTLAEGVAHALDDSESLLGDSWEAIGAEFDAWRQTQQTRRRQCVGAAMAARCDAAERVGDWPDALLRANELLALDPLSEAAHYRVMRLHYLAGDRAAVQLAFERCTRMLEHEFGVAPSTATIELRQTIERSARSMPALAGAQPLFAIAAMPVSVLRPPRRIGRESAWAALGAACDERRVVLLSGEPGMGKSRLLSDAVRATMAEPLDLLMASARPGDAGVPYALLARCLRALLGGFELVPIAAARQVLARVLPELCEAAPVSGEADRSRLVHALDGLIAEAAARGLRALVVDDFQFADDASAELLAPLISSGHIGWVLAMRRGELSAAGAELVERLSREAQVESITLQPLAKDEIAELLASLDIAGIGGELQAAALQQRTGGNPMYLLETLKAGLGATAVRHGAPTDGAAARPFAWPSAPNVVRLIQQRLARLSPLAMQVARCAAVAGQDLSSSLVAHVLGMRPLDLADAWAELEEAQVLRGAAFAHDLIAEAALASVPEAIARPLHDEIAGFLEGIQGEAARVAGHWVAAGRPLRAAPHLMAAARRAEHLWRLREAADLYQRAGAILREAGQRRAAFDAFACEANAWSNVEPARMAVCGQALNELIEDDGQRAIAALVDMVLLLESRRLDEARQVVLRALPLAQRAGLPEIEAELLWGLAIAHWSRREVADAVRFTERSLELLRQVDPATSRLGKTLRERRRMHGLGCLLSAAGRYAQSNELLIEVHAQAQQDNDLGNVLDAANTLAMNAIEQGDVVQASGWSAEAVNGLERLRAALPNRVGKTATRATALALSGELGAALTMFDRVEQLWDEGCLRDAVLPMVRRHLLHHELGRHDLAVKGLRALGALPDLSELERAFLGAARLFIGESADAHAVLEHVGRIDDIAVRAWVLCMAQPGCEPARVLPLLDISLAAARDCAALGLWLGLQTRRVAALRAAGRADEAALAALDAWPRIEQGVVASDLFFPRISAELCLALWPTHPDLAQVIALRGSSWMQRATSTLPVGWRENYLMRSPMLGLLQGIRGTLPIASG